MTATITKKIELAQPLESFAGNTIDSFSGGAVTSFSKWDNITSDVLQAKTFMHSQGINGITPTSRVASPGKFTFYLKNRGDANSAGLDGYYSLEHTNTRGGFEQGAEVRVCYTYDGTEYCRWRGKIYNITPDPSKYTAATKVVAYDWMKTAQDQKFKVVDVETDQRGDQAIQTMINVLPASRQPNETSFDTGKSTFPYVFDSERDEKTSVMSVLQKIAQSELGKVYINSGTNGEQLIFEDRHHAIDETTVQHDFEDDDEVVSVSASYPFDLIKTKVQSIAHPRDLTSADTKLAEIQKSFRLGAGETREVKLLFRDQSTGERISGTSLTTLASGTDYVANAAEGGGGADQTASLSVTTTESSGNSVTLSCENTSGTTIWVTTLQQRGTGIRLYDPVTYETEANNTYIVEKGENVLRYDLPYEDDYNVAVDFGDYLLSVWKDPVCQIDGISYYPEVSASLAQAFCDIDIGHRITVNLSQLGIDQDYFVRKISVTLNQGKIKCSYGVTPAQGAVYMQLDDTTYGVLDNNNCKLAF